MRGVSPGIYFKTNLERGESDINWGLVIWKTRSSGRARRFNTFSQRVVNKPLKQHLIKNRSIEGHSEETGLQAETL